MLTVEAIASGANNAAPAIHETRFNLCLLFTLHPFHEPILMSVESSSRKKELNDRRVNIA
jgi:hypothetical protein